MLITNGTSINQEHRPVSCATKSKIGFFAIGFLLVGSGCALYFPGVNAIGGYVLGGAGAATISGALIYIVVDYKRKKKEEQPLNQEVETLENPPTQPKKFPSWFESAIQDVPCLEVKTDKPTNLNEILLKNPAPIVQLKHNEYTFFCLRLHVEHEDLALPPQQENTESHADDLDFLTGQKSRYVNHLPSTNQPFKINAYLYPGKQDDNKWFLALSGPKMQHRGETFFPREIISDHFKSEGFNECDVNLTAQNQKDLTSGENHLNWFICGLLQNKTRILSEYKSNLSGNALQGQWKISIK